MVYSRQYKLLTESEIHELLGEERHYPTFLDGFKDKVLTLFTRNAKEKMKHGGKIEPFEIVFDNEYCERLVFSPIITKGNVDNDECEFSYYNDSVLYNGKLESPTIYFTIRNNETYDELEVLSTIYLAHELNHLYDDWMWQKNGHKPLCLSNIATIGKRIGIASEVMPSELSKPLHDMVYMSSWTEQNAFVSQVKKELRKLNATTEDYREKMIRTIAYRNMSNARSNFLKAIEKSSDKEVFFYCQLLKSYRKELRINSLFSNTDGMMEKLLEWAEWISKRFFKRFYSVVGLYLDELPFSAK